MRVIAVRPGASIGAYTTLTPRQQLTATPYALYAKNGWSLTGNNGTTADTNFVGTTDNVPLELKVNNARVLRLEPNGTSPNVIGGHTGNNVTTNVFGATIVGGGTSVFTNRVTDNFGTVGGGSNNQAGDNAGTTSDKQYATIGGGSFNTASGQYSTVGAGIGTLPVAIQLQLAGAVRIPPAVLSPRLVQAATTTPVVITLRLAEAYSILPAAATPRLAGVIATVPVVIMPRLPEAMKTTPKEVIRLFQADYLDRRITMVRWRRCDLQRGGHVRTRRDSGTTGCRNAA